MKQIKLSPTQTAILAAACARPDGCVFPIAAKLRSGAVRVVCRSLLARGLVEEAPASDPSTAWREDEEAGPVTVRTTALAHSVLDLARARDEAAAASRRRTWSRKSSKQAMLIAMMRRPEGAAMLQIIEATGWQSQTVRNVIYRVLKMKLGLNVATKREEGRRVYRIKD